MTNVLRVLFCAFALSASSLAAAQSDEQATTASSSSSTAQSARSAEEVKKALAEVSAKMEQAQAAARFVRTLTNVQIELTLSDQAGTQPPVKKSVSMIVSSGHWGKIRSAGTIRPIGDSPFAVDLNVDARPFVSVDGPIQLELTLVYSPPRGSATSTENANAPAGVNQSLTVILQSGKPLIISQAADPFTDRKVLVEVKATVLK
jgi:hypothetical protein